MNATVVRYRVEPGRGDENAALVETVYEELRAAGPPGFRYATFRLDDGVSFVHVAVVDDDSRPLTRLAAFKRFQKGLHERCVEGPEVTPASVVGSYGFVDP